MYSLKNIKTTYKKSKISFSKTKFIHVAGTNGKGSTARALNYILRKKGYNVGLYTSPHLIDLEERIIINNKKISKIILKRKLTKFKKENLSFFEALTLSAIEWFSENNLDFVILEVGLGGRLDATNIIDSDITILCSIGKDHQNLLGEKLENIAEEKLAVLKEKKILINGEIELFDFVNLEARKKNAKIFNYGKDFYYESFEIGMKTSYINTLKLQKQIFKNFYVNLKTKDHLKNLALAMMAAKQLINYNLKEISLNNFYLKGQLECFKLRNNIIYVDTAHNVPAVSSVMSFFHKKKINPTVFLSVLKDKDIKGILTTIKKFDIVLIPTFEFSERGFKYGELLKFKKKVLKNFTEAFSYIKTEEKKDFIFLGSNYTYAQVYKLFEQNGVKHCF